MPRLAQNCLLGPAPAALTPARSGVRPWLLALCLAAGMVACGGGDEPPATPAPPAAPVAPTTESALAATARIGPDGGSVAATSSKGVTYTLVIPLGALAEAVDIRLTPIADMRVAPLARGFLGAVQMEPSGLKFLRTATLRIGAVATLRAGESLVGFGSANDGSGLALKLAQVVNGQTEIAVTHFSTSASATATAEEIAQVPKPSATDSASTLEFREEVMDKVMRMPWSESTAQALGVDAALLFNSWYVLDVEPRLLAALAAAPADVSDSRYLLAIDAYEMWSASWRRIDALTGGQAGLASLLSRLDTDARTLVARGLVALTDFAVGQCISQSSLRALQFAAARQIQASQLGLAATDAFGLSSASFVAKVNSCLRPVLDPTVLPTPLSLGQAKSLDARAQVVFADNPNPQAAPFIFTVEALGATLARPTGRSDASGGYTTVFTPTADPVQFSVRACLVFDLISVDTATEFCVSQKVSAALAAHTLQGNLSRTFAVADLFDPRAQFQLGFTGFLRIGVDAAGAVSVLEVSGTEERASTLSPDSNSCFDPALGRNVPISLKSSSTAHVGSARYTLPLLGSGLGAGFVFFGERTLRGERLASPIVNCDVTTDVFTETPSTGLFALDVLKVERNAAGQATAVLLGLRNPAVNGQSIESLRLTIGP